MNGEIENPHTDVISCQCDTVIIFSTYYKPCRAFKSEITACCFRFPQRPSQAILSTY